MTDGIEGKDFFKVCHGCSKPIEWQAETAIVAHEGGSVGIRNGLLYTEGDYYHPQCVRFNIVYQMARLPHQKRQT